MRLILLDSRPAFEEGSCVHRPAPRCSASARSDSQTTTCYSPWLKARVLIRQFRCSSQR